MSIQELTPSRVDVLAPGAEARQRHLAPISILAAVGGAEDDEAAIAVAADLAERHGSTVTVVNTFEPGPAAVTPRGFATGMAVARVWESFELERRAVAARIDRLLKDYASRRASAGEARDFLRLALPSSGAWATLLRELPLADIAVLAQSSVKGEGPWVGPLGEALMATRTPVYVARDGRTASGRPAAIAWDGGFEAARAVRAALPLLADASALAILQAPKGLEASEGERADPERLKDWLATHGLAVETVVNVTSQKVGDGLLAAAKDFGAALFVAGAYHHSRIEEALFGGATRAFLADGEGPHLLVAH